MNLLNNKNQSRNVENLLSLFQKGHNNFVTHVFEDSFLNRALLLTVYMISIILYYNCKSNYASICHNK